jgi:DNA-binding SARP family transcriptional activator
LSISAVGPTLPALPPDALSARATAAATAWLRHSSNTPSVFAASDVPPVISPAVINGRLTLVTLGGASLVRSGPDATMTVVSSGKPLALLVYLACTPERSATRDHLVELLWSNLGATEAKHALRQSLWYLRRRAAEGIINADGDMVSLASPVESDRSAFLAHIERDELEDAIGLYKGDFLANFAVPGGIRFEHWADGERRHLALSFLRAAEVVARSWMSSGRARDAVTLARRARDADPYTEGAWRLLLEALGSAGDRVGAAAEADRLETMLRAEEHDPEPATLAAIRAARDTRLPAAQHHSTTLVTELVGRESEFSAILAEWDAVKVRGGRHVAVVAPAGLGKTRLLYDVGARIRASRATAVQVRAFPGDRNLPHSFIGSVAAAIAELPGAAGISPESSRALLALNPGIQLSYSGPPDTAHGGEALRRRSLAVLELVAAVTEDRRVALLLDDCQWADESSAAIIRMMVDKVKDNRLLLVTAMRPPGDATLTSTDSIVVTLPPLTDAQTHELLAGIATLPSDPWAERLHSELCRVTGGSPLLVLETLQLLLDRKTLRLSDGEWVADSPESLATALHSGGALQARVATLPPPHRKVLALLATAGAPLSQGALQRALPTEPALQRITEDLEHRGLTERTVAGWQAAHDEIGFGALATLDRRDVGAIHDRIGRALADDPAADEPTLRRAASHLAMAGSIEPLKALAYRWIMERRARGYLRPAKLLLRELLGDNAELNARITKTLPWPTRIDRRPVVLAGGALMALFVVVLAALAISTPQRAEHRLLLGGIAGDAGQAAFVELDLGSLRQAGVAKLGRVERNDALRQLASGGSGHLAIDADQQRAAYHRESGDSGGLDLHLRNRSGQEQRLTSTPLDDVGPTWSPDGRTIAFVSARWDPERRRHQVALLDVATGVTRRLTNNVHVDGPPYWSPDGIRIGFMRNRFDFSPAELCWVAVDGSRERCVTPNGGRLVQVLGWTTQRSLLVIVDVLGTNRLGVAEMRTGNTRILDVGSPTTATAIHNREWVVCDCSPDPGMRAGLSLVYVPTEEVFPLVRGSEPVTYFDSYAWNAPDNQRSWIDSLVVETPASGVPLGARVKLNVAGVTPAGNRLEVPQPPTRWSISDTTVATVDSLGVITARARGSAVVSIDVGGWRRTSSPVLVTAASWSRVITEDWTNPLPAIWEAFGTPQPSTVQAGAGRALIPNGDGSQPGGVRSRDGWPAATGIGLEVRLSTPLTQMQWQRLVVALERYAPERRSGRIRGPGGLASQSPGCSIMYPASEGSAGVDRLRLVHRTVVTSPRLRSGEWYTLRLQLFPDGRCGLALDGLPRALSESGGQPTGSYNLQLFGSMVGTRLLIGPIEVWTGVRDGVDWAILDGTLDDAP